MLLDDYEEFSDSQRQILDNYVTNTRGHIFVLRNLPDVIKGALFSRYSRSSLGLRALLLKEFVVNEEESAFKEIARGSDNEESEDQTIAIKKAQNFYDRILDGYGDDSIGELGGAHLAIENVSMLAAKLIEDCRIGGSPLEKSTRYIYFDQKVHGEYLFYREPVLMTSAFRDLYVDTCNALFQTYGRLIPPLTALIEKQMPHDPGQSRAAYSASLRAKVLDCLRGLLPAGTLTNMGIYGNGRFYEGLIHKLHTNNLNEMQAIGKRAHEELAKVIPSFIRRSEPSHRTHESYRRFHETLNDELQEAVKLHTPQVKRATEPGVFLRDSDADAAVKVAAALLYEQSDKGLYELQQYCQGLPQEEIETILEAGAAGRDSRRHKSPRALEHVNYTFEIVADFGAYRDLHRHRMLTQERQLLCCDYGYFIPPEIVGTEMESEYIHALEQAQYAHAAIAAELPEEAQYIIPMAYNVRWYFHVNLRALQWLCELRSAAPGHPCYRHIAQEMARQVMETTPAFSRFFQFVDFDDYALGRLGQEEQQQSKQTANSAAL